LSFIAEASKSTERSANKPSRCCSCFSRNSNTFEQTMVILRHSERKDYVDPSYLTSEEGKQWPNDAPLTPYGVALAAEVAHEILELHATANFAAVAVSPYRRCLETAAEVAKLLKRPVIVDQEIGEVWDGHIPKEPNPFRLGTELTDMLAVLGVESANPVLEAGGIKVFGKVGNWPESLEDAKKRYLVRIQSYVEHSLEVERNYILVTHADAVSAAVQMFGQGTVDVQNVDFCARLTASRSIKLKNKHQHTGMFAEDWDVEAQGIEQEVFYDGCLQSGMGKIYKQQHDDKVEDVVQHAVRRRRASTKSDDVFLNCLENSCNMNGFNGYGSEYENDNDRSSDIIKMGESVDEQKLCGSEGSLRDLQSNSKYGPENSIRRGSYHSEGSIIEAWSMPSHPTVAKLPQAERLDNPLLIRL